MPYPAKVVRTAHATVEGKSTGMPKAFAKRAIAEQHGHAVLPDQTKTKKKKHTARKAS